MTLSNGLLRSLNTTEELLTQHVMCDVKERFNSLVGLDDLLHLPIQIDPLPSSRTASAHWSALPEPTAALSICICRVTWPSGPRAACSAWKWRNSTMTSTTQWEKSQTGLPDRSSCISQIAAWTFISPHHRSSMARNT